MDTFNALGTFDKICIGVVALIAILFFTAIIISRVKYDIEVHDKLYGDINNKCRDDSRFKQ